MKGSGEGGGKRERRGERKWGGEKPANTGVLSLGYRRMGILIFSFLLSAVFKFSSMNMHFPNKTEFYLRRGR